MSKNQSGPGVWTIAWGVFWGMMLWTLITGVLGFLLWAASCAAVIGGAAAAGRAAQPPQKAVR